MNSNIDEPMTGDVRTDSRVALEEDIRRRLAEAQRHGNRISLILIRIGNLAQLTAKHGNSAGKRLIKACTQFFAGAAREMDLVARLDHDIFGIELPGATLMDAVNVANRIKGQIETCPLQMFEQKLNFRISVGAAEAQPEDDTPSLIARAEKALQVSVETPGNPVHWHNRISVETSLSRKDQQPVFAM